MKLRYKIGLVIAVLGGMFLWGRCNRPSTDSESDGGVPLTVLPKQDREQIIVNPDKHQLIIVRPEGNETLTLPDRSSTIDIRKDGTVKVNAAQFGFEHHITLGVMFSNQFRVAIGPDLFFYKKLDLGLGVADKPGLYTPVVYAKVTYNIWSNTQVGLTIDNNKHVGALLSVRL